MAFATPLFKIVPPIAIETGILGFGGSYPSMRSTTPKVRLPIGVAAKLPATMTARDCSGRLII
jgi:hypothetical protein